MNGAHKNRTPILDSRYGEFGLDLTSGPRNDSVFGCLGHAKLTRFLEGSQFYTTHQNLPCGTATVRGKGSVGKPLNRDQIPMCAGSRLTTEPREGYSMKPSSVIDEGQ